MRRDQTQYRIFFDAVRLDEPLEASDAIPAAASEIVEDYLPLIKEDREYLGIIDASGTTLQILYLEEEDEYWVEVPYPAERGSYGILLRFEEVCELLTMLPTLFPVRGFSGFTFQAW